MRTKPKSTYLVFRHGKSPDKLRLGNLVTNPYDPEDNDPFTFRKSLDELEHWTGGPEKEPHLSIELNESHGTGVTFTCSSVAQTETSGAKSTHLRIDGKDCRRFQIDRAFDFLNEEVLDSAKTWLDTKVRISRHAYYLSKLKYSKARKPQIWMVTGIQLLSDVTVRHGSIKSDTIQLGFQSPSPEIVSAVTTFLLADRGIAGASVSRSREKESITEYQHTEERVWAAQFRRLNIDFIREDLASCHIEGPLSLQSLLDVGRHGFRSATLPKESFDLDGVAQDDVNDLLAAQDDDDEDLLKRLSLSATSHKYALLIGGCEKNLSGVRNDLRAMSDLLLDLKFDVTVCYGNQATRIGIMKSWSDLAQRLSANDTVVVYYSGHGGAEKDENEYVIQYILPTDVEDTTVDSFHGILDIELSYMITALTDQTPNVTVILDCCHSGESCRLDASPRRSNSVSRTAIDAHMERIKSSGLLAQRLHIEANPFSVRIVAAERDQLAFEDHGSRDGLQMGRLTRQLITEIRNVGSDVVSWDVILSQLRKHLNSPEMGFKRQRPQIEGPKMRAIFSLDLLAHFGQLGVESRQSRITLMGGTLLGIQPGDEYAIVPQTTRFVDTSKPFMKATVRRVTTDSAQIEITESPNESVSLERARAFPLNNKRARFGVCIEAENPALKEYLNSKLAQARTIDHMESAITKGAEACFATIQQQRGVLTLIHQNKDPSFQYPFFGQDWTNAVSTAIHQVQQLARAHDLLHLRPRDEESLDDTLVKIEVGSVEDGVTSRFDPAAKFEYLEDQCAYLKIFNYGKQAIFASVFLVTSMGTIEWLSSGAPSGQSVLPGGKPYIPQEGTYDERLNTEIGGFCFSWPPSVPRRGSLRESFVIVLTNQRVDLGLYATQEVEEDPVVLSRELNRARQKPRLVQRENLRFAARRIEFDLVPDQLPRYVD